MINSKFIRIISVFGILALLTLQYVWLRNAYLMEERAIMEKSKECLREAVDEELFERCDKAKTKVKIINTIQKKPGSKLISSGEINQAGDINIGLQDLMCIFEIQCSLKKVETLIQKKMLNRLSFIPTHTLRIISDSTRYKKTVKLINAGESNNFTPNIDSIYQKDSCKIYDVICGNTIFMKMDSKRSFELVLTSPAASVIARAKFIFIISILLVLLIGFVLILQFKSMLKDKEFTNFMKDYTRILTHEMRTPVNDIFMLTSRLISGTPLDSDKINLYHKENLNQCSKLLLNIDNILYVAKSEQRKLTILKSNVDLRLFINKIADKYRNITLLRKSLNIHTNFHSETLIAYIDEELMENVVLNLIENAIKYSRETVEISISCAIENNHFILKIKDNGFGISKSELKSIFQIFDRGKQVSSNQIKGFGIGLYYVHTVVKAHRGKVEVRSEEGVGSEFIIDIPNRFQ